MTTIWTPAQSNAALAEGWDLFESDGEHGTKIELQAWNDAGIFKGDDQAWRHVVDRAIAGSELHRAALAHLREINPAEYKNIVDVSALALADAVGLTNGPQ
jgi:hypothetical protein